MNNNTRWQMAWLLIISITACAGAWGLEEEAGAKLTLAGGCAGSDEGYNARPRTYGLTLRRDF